MISSAIPVFFDPRQQTHQPTRDFHEGRSTAHSEQPSRAEMILAQTKALMPTADFGMEPILRVHAPDYVEFLRTAHAQWLAAGREGETFPVSWPVVHRRSLRLTRIEALLGRYSFDVITPIGELTWPAAYWSAQTALSALQVLLQGGTRTAFALCRPPGHHAGRDYFGGYGYLNNAAIVAAHARQCGRRVAILDIDLHHGNGTQDIFYEDADVFFVSIHADPSTNFPYFWGHADETGSGAGEGFNLNLPLPSGTAAAEYLSAVECALGAISRNGADLLVLSFGVDTFAQDPFADFRLLTGDYPKIASRIAGLNMPVLIVMEGGYAVDALGENVSAFLSGF